MIRTLAISMLLGAAVANEQATIQGDANSITMQVPGATLTFASDTAPNGDSFKQSWVDRELISDTVQNAVDYGTQEMVTTNAVVDAIQDVATQETVSHSLKGTMAQEYLTSALFAGDGCNSSMHDTQTSCPSGDASIVVSFQGVGLITGSHSLYSCVFKSGGITLTSPAKISISVGYRQQLQCDAPALYNEQSTIFTADVTVITSSGRTLAHLHTNPLITFYNEGPYIYVPPPFSVVVVGECSELVLGKSVPLTLVYGDKYDDDTTLITVFKSLSTDAVEDNTASFVLNKTTKVVNINFVKSWMDEFRQRVSTNGEVTQEIKFQMSVTDSQQKTTTKIFAFNVSHDDFGWKADSSAYSMIENKPFTEILTRAGLNQCAKIEKCYSVKRDGWDVATYHRLCDNKGPLLLMLKRSGSDRIFGGYLPFAEPKPNCRYVSAVGRTPSEYGNVKPGQDASDRGWMFRIMDNTPNAPDFAWQTRYPFYMRYMCPLYFPTWGNGFDFTCNQNLCQCRIGVGYQTNYNYPGYNWCTGVFTFTASESAFDFYEVYTTR